MGDKKPIEETGEESYINASSGGIRELLERDYSGDEDEEEVIEGVKEDDGLDLDSEDSNEFKYYDLRLLNWGNRTAAREGKGVIIKALTGPRVRKICYLLANDVTISEVCKEIGINVNMFHSRYRTCKEFRKLVDASKKNLHILAKQKVREGIEKGGFNEAMKFLEKRDRKRYGEKTKDDEKSDDLGIAEFLRKIIK